METLLKLPDAVEWPWTESESESELNMKFSKCDCCGNRQLTGLFLSRELGDVTFRLGHAYLFPIFIFGCMGLWRALSYFYYIFYFMYFIFPKFIVMQCFQHFFALTTWFLSCNLTLTQTRWMEKGLFHKNACSPGKVVIIAHYSPFSSGAHPRGGPPWDLSSTRFLGFLTLNWVIYIFTACVLYAKDCCHVGRSCKPAGWY